MRLWGVVLAVALVSGCAGSVAGTAVADGAATAPEPGRAPLVVQAGEGEFLETYEFELTRVRLNTSGGECVETLAFSEACGSRVERVLALFRQIRHDVEALPGGPGAYGPVVEEIDYAEDAADAYAVLDCALGQPEDVEDQGYCYDAAWIVGFDSVDIVLEGLDEAER